MIKTARIFKKLAILPVLLTLMVPIAFAGDISLVGTRPNLLPRIWFGANSDWTDHTVTTQPETFIEITINNKNNNSLLKVGFSGGRLSFTTDDYGLNSQVVFSIYLDGVVMAESLDYDSSPGFRNKYPAMSTLIENVSAGTHTVSVAVSKTNNPGEGGDVTYTTNIGHVPNTYKAYLTVEEWQKK